MRDIAKERSGIEAAIGEMTLVDVLHRNADRFGSLPALHWSDDDGSHHLSWSAYRDTVVKVAAGLRSIGVEASDFIGIMCGNRPEHVISDLAALLAGAIPVSLYNTLATPQIQYVAAHCEAKVAIVENLEYMKRWEEAKADLPALEYIVLLEGAENYEATDWVLSWDELVRAGTTALADDPTLVERASERVKPDDLATLIYTSGTTGTPKGVMISHRNVLWTTECTNRAIDNIPDHPRWVSYLPLAHIGERLATHYSGLWLAGSVTYVADIAGVAAAVQTTKPQVFFAVPRVWEKFQAGLMARMEAEPNERRRALALGAVELATRVVRARQAGEAVSAGDKIKMGVFEKLVFSKIRKGLGLDELAVAISAAAPISAELLMFFRGIGLPIYELFGMTESTGPGVTNTPGADKIGSVGRAMPGVEVMTAEDDEIFMRGGLVTQGYYKDPEATAETFDQDGWLHTGDLGRIDDEGFLTIIGRKKEIIINAAGKNIAPAKLENLINQHGLIAQACVIGEARKYITVVVALDIDVAPAWAESNGVTFDSLEQLSVEPELVAEVERIVEGANEQVARVEQAKKFYISGHDWSPESGELTPSLKLKRRVVHENYSADIEAMYAE